MLSKEDLILESKIIHCNKYDYKKVNFIDSSKKVKIICPKHAEFSQTFQNHIYAKKGCSKCISFNKNEGIWLDSINLPDDEFHRNVLITIGNLKYLVLGFNPLTKTIYEYNIDYWHGNLLKYSPDDIHPELQVSYKDIWNKSEIRHNLFKRNGYEVVSIWESNFLESQKDKAKIIIHDNKKAQFITTDIRAFNKLRRLLSFKTAGVEYTAAYKNGWDGITYLLDAKGYFLSGLLTKVEKFAKDNNIVYTIIDRRTPIVKNEELDLSAKLNELGMIPRDYQNRIVEAAVANNKGIIRAATSSGKCNSIDSLNITEHGLLNYAELMEINGISSLNVNDAVKFEIKLATPLTKENVDAASLLYYDGYGPSRKIKTRYGFELTATPEHQIKIIDNNGNFVWSKVSELKEKDYCAISYGNNLFGKKSIPLDEAYWYGLLIGDGVLTTKRTVRLTNMDDHILNFSMNYLKNKNIKGAKLSNTKSKAKDIIVYNTKYRNELFDFGFKYEKSIHKTLPINIRMLEKKSLAMVIRGIYETDGWIEDTKSKTAICLGLSNKKLIDQIHLILLNYGIVAARRIKKTYREDCHILSIYREFIPIFMKEIGLDPLGHKFKKIQAAMNLRNKELSSTNFNIVPNQNKKIEVLKLFFEKSYSKKCLIKNCIIKYDMLRSWRGDHFWRLPSKNKLIEFCNWYKDWFISHNNVLPDYISNIIDDLIYLCNERLFYLDIQNIEETFSENYDFYIPETHSFVSQGFINHNTLCTALVTAKLNKPTIIYVIGLDLLDQFHKFFSKVFDEKIGYIGNGICDPQRITIASIWTIGKALDLKSKDIISDNELGPSEKDLSESNKEKIIKLLKECKVHQIDECHIILSNTISKVLDVIDPEYILGFSGTPYKNGIPNLQINGILGEEIVNVTATELINKGVIAKPIIKFITVPKMSGVGVSYQEAYKNYIVENDVRNDLIIKYTKELLEKKYVPLILFKQIKHGDIIADKLTDAGIKFGMLSGNDSLEKRNEVKDRLIKKEIDLILASTIFDIGLDLPILSALVLCGAEFSLLRLFQRTGRIVRGFPGKKSVAIVDFYDQVKFFKKHSMERYKTYSLEEGFKLIPSKEMKID